MSTAKEMQIEQMEHDYDNRLENRGWVHRAAPRTGVWPRTGVCEQGEIARGRAVDCESVDTIAYEDHLADLERQAEAAEWAQIACEDHFADLERQAEDAEMAQIACEDHFADLERQAEDAEMAQIDADDCDAIDEEEWEIERRISAFYDHPYDCFGSL